MKIGINKKDYTVRIAGESMEDTAKIGVVLGTLIRRSGADLYKVTSDENENMEVTLSTPLLLAVLIDEVYDMNRDDIEKVVKLLPRNDQQN